MNVDELLSKYLIYRNL